MTDFMRPSAVSARYTEVSSKRVRFFSDTHLSYKTKSHISHDIWGFLTECSSLISSKIPASRQPTLWLQIPSGCMRTSELELPPSLDLS